MDDDRRRVTRLVGVYDADHTLRGEVSYWIGARLGRAHCALCDISHGMLRRRSEWNAYVAGLSVPFDTFHRDDQPAPVRVATGGRAPVVVAETSDGVVILLDAAALEACDRSVPALAAALDRSLAAAHLRL